MYSRLGLAATIPGLVDGTKFYPVQTILSCLMAQHGQASNTMYGLMTEIGYFSCNEALLQANAPGLPQVIKTTTAAKLSPEMIAAAARYCLTQDWVTPGYQPELDDAFNQAVDTAAALGISAPDYFDRLGTAPLLEELPANIGLR